MAKNSEAKHCLNLKSGKKGRLLFVHTNPVYNPQVKTIVDGMNAGLTFGSITTKWISNLRATVRFKISVAAAAPAAAPPAALTDPPTDGELTITLVDVDSSGTETPVDLEPIEVDYIDDPDDP